jgi:hypothetical protein
MRKAYKTEVVRLFGDDALKGSSLAKLDNDTVHFMVTECKQPNFMNHCDRLTVPKDPVKTINQYTDHTTELYAKVNLALAADSDVLGNFSDFVTELRSSILTQPLFDDCLVYRGVELSPEEISQMERLGSFFIPSFTSTSVDPTKSYEKSHTMVIKLPYACKYSCSITPALSKFYHEEQEVLISCYSAFRLERIEPVNKSKTVLTLYLDEHLSSLPSLSPTTCQ